MPPLLLPSVPRYEAFFLLRRGLVALFYVYLEPWPVFRSVVMFTMCVFLFMSHIIFLPYRLRGDNVLATLLNVSLIVIAALEIPLATLRVQMDMTLGGTDKAALYNEMYPR